MTADDYVLNGRLTHAHTHLQLQVGILISLNFKNGRSAYDYQSSLDSIKETS